MSLLAIHTAELAIPEVLEENRSIAGNRLSWQANPAFLVGCEFFEHDRNSLLAKTSLDPPWDEMVLRLPHCRAEMPTHKPVLKVRGPFSDIAAIGPETALEWVRHPADRIQNKPEDIVASWKDGFRFKEENIEDDMPGLRRPQLGAIHAVAAYLAVQPEEAATVVMPTGTGKAETMLGALVCCQCSRVLLLAPSDILRSQLFDKFRTLGCLPDIGAVGRMIGRPRVALIKRGIHDPAECARLVKEANVLIALPYSLRNFSDDARQTLVDSCSHLFIDEAHHVAAQTWTTIKKMFAAKPVVQFTATPFRRDGKSLEGRVIFNYKLSEAQWDGYFRHIRLHAVEEYGGITDVDVSIAEKAISTLRADLEAGRDHLLLARTRSISRAEEILPIYQRLAGDLNPVVVHSDSKRAQSDEAFAALRNRSSRAIVCVDMLGEGFDLPNLKVAALHDHHKSLAITLQFIGRFTRSAQEVGDAAAVVNIAEPKVQDDLQALYAEDADWDEILSRGSEDTIAREIALLDLVNHMRDHGDLAKQLSLWNLRPACSAIVHRTVCDSWTPLAFADLVPERFPRWHALSQSDNVLVVVVAREEEVTWGKYRDLKDKTLELMVAHWDSRRNALFLYCSDYDFFRSEKMAHALCGESTTPVTGEKLFRVFGGVELPMVRNLGASKAGSISFTMYFGPDVTNGLSLVEESQSVLSNLTGWGYEDGDKVTWGCSQKKGKIWSVHGGPVTEWMAWCCRAWDKIANDDTPEAEIISGFLRPKPLLSRYPSCPAFVQWGEGILGEPEEKVVISIGDRDFRANEVDLDVATFEPDGPLRMAIRSEACASTYELHVSEELTGGFEYRLVEGPEVFVQVGRGQRRTFPERMVRDPVVITYVDGSFSYNAYIVNVTEERAPFDATALDAWSWQHTDLTVEAQGKERLRESIQYRLCQELYDEYTVVFDDHAKGEAADIIGIRAAGDRVMQLCLVHCKKPGGAVGARVDDMYELCGQGQKCVRWKHSGFSYLTEHMKRRKGLWTATGATRFVKGGLADLAKLRKQARSARIELEVILVQPGISKTGVTESILELLGSTELYLKKTADAMLRVVCSF